MRISDNIHISTIDYPGEICTMLYTVGCNLRCHYCHNKPLVFGTVNCIEIPELFKRLKAQKEFTPFITITGGEPTIQRDIISFIRKLKDRGFFVKLDTNGLQYNTLRHLVNHQLVDYIAMDLKTELCSYARPGICGTRKDTNRKSHPYPALSDWHGSVEQRNLRLREVLLESMHILESSTIPHEYRTTCCKDVTSPTEIAGIADDLEGVYNEERSAYPTWFIQRATIEDKSKEYTEEELREIVRALTIQNYKFPIVYR